MTAEATEKATEEAAEKESDGSYRTAQGADALRCHDCQGERFTTPEGTCSVCNDRRTAKGELLCPQCTIMKGLCITCGEPRIEVQTTEEKTVTPDKRFDKKADRRRRRRELKAANVVRNEQRPETTLMRRQSRKARGLVHPQRQRHRPPTVH